MVLFSNYDYFPRIVFNDLLVRQWTARHKQSIPHLLLVILAFLLLFSATEAYPASTNENNKLIAVNDTIATNTNSKISIDVLKNDSYIEPVTLTIVSRPAHADSWVAYNNTISYRPRTNNFGQDSLIYKITDVHGNASMASVEITMLQTGTNTTENSGTDNNKLIAVNDIIATNTNSKISIDVLKNDSYIEPVTLTIVSRPAHADSWVAYNNTISYRPRTNNFDKDSLTYKITDVNGNASKASVEITMLQTSTNRLVCEDAAGQLQTTKDGVKWYPGHYLRKNAEEKSLYAEDILFLENPYTQGLILMVKWKNLEKAKNQYDFSVIDKYIKWIEPYGKRIAMRIMDRCFHGCTDADAPAYLRTDSRYHGGVEPMREGSIIRLWDPAVTDRVIALYQALGAKYNGNPTVAAITIGSGESAMAIDREKAAGYSPEAYERELVRKAVEVKKAFPNTIVLTGMNFIRGGEPRLTRIAEELAKIGGSGVITPRAYPHSQYYVYDTFRKMKGKIAIFPQVETGGLLPEETEELIYRFAVNDLGANFLSWNAAFYNSQDKRPNYLTNYVLPVVTKYKGATKTACPTSFAKCVTQCP